MQQNFTPQLLVKHLYNETDAAEANAVENALTNNKALQEEFTALQETKYALDETDGELPSISSIKNILAFAKQEELSATH